jgi:hypothetical protein
MQMSASFDEIGGGYSFQSLRVGMIVRAPNGKQIYIQPGDDETAMRANIEALDEISEDVTDAKRGKIADMVLGEYFA